MELVGKKFRVKDDFMDTVYTIEEVGEYSNSYKITWMESNEDEVEEQSTTYYKSDTERMLNSGIWILENE